MTTWNLHKNTLTYILICLGIAFVLEVPTKREIGQSHERGTTAAGDEGAAQRQRSPLRTAISIPGRSKAVAIANGVHHEGIQPVSLSANIHNGHPLHTH